MLSRTRDLEDILELRQGHWYSQPAVLIVVDESLWGLRRVRGDEKARNVVALLLPCR
jgi:hypothetical protein